MSRISSSCAIASVIIALAIPFQTSTAGGLRTQLGEVVIENLQVGQTYNLKDLANLSLIVTNTSDFTLDLKMDVLVPSDGELKLEAQAIPEASWVELSQDFYTVEPGAQAVSDILISIPDDEQYLGKTYQVVIWSHSLARPGSGMTLAYGLKSRIIFTIDPVRAEPVDLVLTSDASVGFSVGPQEIKLKDVAAGVLWDVEEKAGVLLTISNPGTQIRKVQLKSQTVANSSASVTKGFEDTPDASYLRFNEDELVLEPGEIRTVRMYLDFPANNQHAGHHYMFIIHALTVGEKVSTGVYSRLYASVI